MAWLLDTNVLSELRKPKAERKVLDFIASTPLSQLNISIVSLAEVRYGIELSADTQKRAALQDWLAVKVRPMFDPLRTLPVTEDVILKWRLMLAHGRKTGHTFSQPDLSIGRHRSTSRSHGRKPRPYSLRTRERESFESLGRSLTRLQSLSKSRF